MSDRRLVTRARATVAWAVAGLAVLQLGLLADLEKWQPELRDPEYGGKLARLRARLRERPGDGPRVLLLGSSRVGVGFRPEVLPCNRPGRAHAPLVFNFALCGSGPVMELVCLRRLLADGVRPDWVLVEVWQPFLQERRPPEVERIDPLRLGWQDLHLLLHYHARQSRLYGGWWPTRVFPFSAYGYLLLKRYAPSWQSLWDGMDVNWRGLDDWGWLRVPPYQAGGPGPVWRQRVRLIRRDYADCFGEHFTLSADADRALRELLGLCRRWGIRPALLLMPDSFRRLYHPAARAAADAYVRRLSGEYQAPVIDARAWAADTEFFDGVHLCHAAAAKLSRRFGREVLSKSACGLAFPAKPQRASRLAKRRRIGYVRPSARGPSPGRG
jgi:hypothetical protein